MDGGSCPLGRPWKTQHWVMGGTVWMGKGCTRGRGLDQQLPVSSEKGAMSMQGHASAGPLVLYMPVSVFTSSSSTFAHTARLISVHNACQPRHIHASFSTRLFAACPFFLAASLLGHCLASIWRMGDQVESIFLHICGGGRGWREVPAIWYLVWGVYTGTNRKIILPSFQRAV